MHRVTGAWRKLAIKPVPAKLRAGRCDDYLVEKIGPRDTRLISVLFYVGHQK
jgi:hypothetical protein